MRENELQTSTYRHMTSMKSWIENVKKETPEKKNTNTYLHHLIELFSNNHLSLKQKSER